MTTHAESPSLAAPSTRPTSSFSHRPFARSEWKPKSSELSLPACRKMACAPAGWLLRKLCEGASGSALRHPKPTTHAHAPAVTARWREGTCARARARARSPGDVVHLAVCDEPAIIRGRVLRDLHSLGTTADGAAVALESAQGRGRRGRELKQRSRVGGSRSRRSALHATHLLHRVHGQACAALGRRSLVGFVEVRGALGERRTLILVGRAARQPAVVLSRERLRDMAEAPDARARSRSGVRAHAGAQRERGGARLPPSRRRPRAPSSNPSPRSLSCIAPLIGVS